MTKQMYFDDPELVRLIEENEKTVAISGATVVFIKKELERINKINKEIDRKISLLL